MFCLRYHYTGAIIKESRTYVFLSVRPKGVFYGTQERPALYLPAYIPLGIFLYGKDTPFWSESYFVATTGTVSMETVKGYIESQKTEAHQKIAYRKRQFKKL